MGQYCSVLAKIIAMGSVANIVYLVTVYVVVLRHRFCRFHDFLCLVLIDSDTV